MGLVVLGCDGVLVGSERIAVRVRVALGAELGRLLTQDEVVDRFIGRQGRLTCSPDVYIPLPW
jgi:beta-phosphoglucomutase-like phosphatase (HAD superfamily)